MKSQIVCMLDILERFLHYVQHGHDYQLTELVYQASIPRSTYLYTNNTVTPIEHDLCSTHLQSYRLLTASESQSLMCPCTCIIL